MRAGDLARFGIDAVVRTPAPLPAPAPVEARRPVSTTQPVSTTHPVSSTRAARARATRRAVVQLRRRLDGVVRAQRDRVLLAELASMIAQADATFVAAQRIFAEVESR